jgi:TM2 domain-containing membrane protein YozV
LKNVAGALDGARPGRLTWTTLPEAVRPAAKLNERQTMYRIIGADGREYGPVTAEQLKQWIAEGRAGAQTRVRVEATGEWKWLGELPEFAATLVPPPPFPTAPPSIAERASKKIPAGICGVLLGWLGVHKFILGYNTAGIIMLLISLVGGVLTCGLATGVMFIIGLIEGIIYLTKSDEDFVRTYVDGRKEWF